MQSVKVTLSGKSGAPWRTLIVLCYLCAKEQSHHRIAGNNEGRITHHVQVR